MAFELLSGGGGGGPESRGLFLFPASCAAGLGVFEFIFEGSPWSLNSHSFICFQLSLYYTYSILHKYPYRITYVKTEIAIVDLN
jgi:hypothetical protein